MFFLFMTSVLNLYLNLPAYSFQLSCVELELEHSVFKHLEPGAC
jgi:hypothetical protein